MELIELSDVKLIASILDLIGWFAAGFWLLRNWKVRREDYPKIGMSLECKQIYADHCERILEVVVEVKNEGEVRHIFNDLSFTIDGSKSLRGSQGSSLLPFQVDLHKDVRLFPRSWEYSFVDAGQTSTYKRLVKIPSSFKLLRCVAKMKYRDAESDFHSVIWHGVF